MRTYVVAAAAAILFAAAVQAQTAVATPDAPAFPSIRVGGFADIELHTSSGNVREGLDLVELDLYSVARFSERWSALGEGVAQRAWRQNERERRLPEFSLERLYVEYAPNDALRIEIGQTHTGIVRWNEREHRSRFLQTPIDVPAIANRESQGGAWPLHFTGAWASGRLPGSLGLTWEVGAGAGPGLERDAIPIFSQDRSPAGFVG